ncbi:MAG: FlgD immunoglobulin-like domain containing protein, partial [Candidatus Desantisbacteria bacterium]
NLNLEIEPNNTFASANTISLSSAISGAFTPNSDQDYFKVNVAQSGKLFISLTNISSNIDAYVYLYDENQTQVAYKYSGGNGKSVALEKEITTPGNYYLKIFDNGNNASSTSLYTLNTNFALFWIDNVSDSPDAFSPNGDNSYETTTITYLITKAAAVTIKIYDPSNTLIRTLKDNLSETQGTHTAIWDGKNNSGVLLPEATYTYKIDATDTQGNPAPQKQGAITIDNNFMRIASPTPGSVLTGTITLRAVPSANVTAFDSSPYFYYQQEGNTNWTYIGTATRQTDGSWTGSWDTKNVSNNNYKIRLQAYYYDLDNKYRSEYTLPVSYTVTNGITISNVSDSPDAFSPNGDNSYETTTITYLITKAANVTVKIYNASNTLIRTLKDNLSETQGTHTAIWDGKNNSGVLLPEATYTYKIDATDTQGNPAPQKQGAITIDNNFMRIASPTPGSVLTGTITLRAVPSANVTAFDSSPYFYYQQEGNTNWTYIGTATRQTDGSWTGSWDTKNVSNNNYKIRLQAYYYDLDNKYRSEYTLPVSYTVTNGITISNVSDSPDAFSPNGDNSYETTTITYLITKAAAVTIKIYDPSNTLIRTLKDNLSETQGTHTAIWDGKNNS